MYKLCWVGTGFSPYSGVTLSVAANSVDEITKIMSKFYYNGEWVLDREGNRVEMNWNEICQKR